jgi:hypothetical protein
MSSQSLFAHMAMRFSAHPENLATEALHYLLGRSQVAKRALCQYLAQAGSVLPADLTFRTQVYDEDAGIPDLVALDDTGQAVLIAEAKFWAGLTEKQPVAYLQRLPEADSLLTFIAPPMRITSLWSELKRRCASAGLRVAAERQVARDFWTAGVGGKRVLALVSWPSLLASLQRALEDEREVGSCSDLAQLQGLCARMDDDAFLPIRSEELTSGIGARVYQFYELAEAVCQASVAAGIASIEGLRFCYGLGYYGRYLKLSGIACALHFNSWRWARLRPTPLWLTVLDEGWKWKPSRPLAAILSPLSLENPSRLIEDEHGLHVPLHVPVGVEKEQVISHVVAQLRGVNELLQTASVRADSEGSVAEPGAEPDPAGS